MNLMAADKADDYARRLEHEIEELRFENMALHRTAGSFSARAFRRTCLSEAVAMEGERATEWAFGSRVMRTADKTSRQSFAGKIKGQAYTGIDLSSRAGCERDTYLQAMAVLTSILHQLPCDEVEPEGALSDLIEKILTKNLCKKLVFYSETNALFERVSKIADTLSRMGCLCVCLGDGSDGRGLVEQRGRNHYRLATPNIVGPLSDIAVFAGKAMLSLDDISRGWAAQSEHEQWLDCMRALGWNIAEQVDERIPSVGVVILSWNNTDYMLNCLLSIFDNTSHGNYEVYVVDNASTDGVKESLRLYDGLFERFHLIENSENLGFPAGNNIGIKKCSDCDYVVLLNNDTYVTPDWLTYLLSHFDADASIGMLGPLSYFCSNAQQQVDFSGCQSNVDYDYLAKSIHRVAIGCETDVDMLQFFCVMISRQVIDEIGGLDEDFGLGVCEDDDYSYRVRRAGYRVVCAEDVFIRHFHNISFKDIDVGQQEKNLEQSIRHFYRKYGEVPKFFRTSEVYTRIRGELEADSANGH